MATKRKARIENFLEKKYHKQSVTENRWFVLKDCVGKWRINQKGELIDRIIIYFCKEIILTGWFNQTGFE